MILKLRRSNCYVCRQILIVLLIFFMIFSLNLLNSNEQISKITDRTMIALLYQNRETSPFEYGYQNKGWQVISKLVEMNNKHLTILNIDSLGPPKEGDIVFVILILKYSNDVLNMISSLMGVSGIDNCLVIFSHSSYNAQFNEVISSIDNVRVLQIYYPHSVQLNPSNFPGPDSSNCSIGLNDTETAFSNANEQNRNRQLVESKHQFWWTANFVFEKMYTMLNNPGRVIFVEEILCFTNDFKYMARFMNNMGANLPQCDFLSFGRNAKPDNTYYNFDAIELQDWNPALYDKIVGLDISIWNTIASHYDLFCSFDDHSWLRSLYYISLNRRDGKKFNTLSPIIPRAFSLLNFGNKEPDEVTNYVETLQDGRDVWYPAFLELIVPLSESENTEREQQKEFKGQGGFAGHRDQALCINMTVSKIKKVVLDMKNNLAQ